MDQKEKIFEDLEYIKTIINDSRNVVIENGIGFIIWGILILIGLTVTYLDILLSGDQLSGQVWVIVVAGGWIYTIIEWMRSRKSRAVTFAGRMIGATWISSGITMCILGFIGPMTNAYYPFSISPVLAAILGIGFYITAQLQNNKLMKILAPFWWIGSIIMFISPGVNTLIIMAAMMLFLQIIPGIIIYRKFKSEYMKNAC